MTTSTSNIHPTAIIDASAHIDESAVIGPYCIIGENVTIGAHTKLLNHVVVRRNTTIGKNNTVYQFATIGEDCQDLKYAGEETWLTIGDNNTFRESSTIHRGTIQDNSITKIGNNNLFMVNCHIAHDCIIGDNNVCANNLAMAGHVHVGSNNIIGGNSGIHQFCRIDDYCMIGGASVVLKDVVAMALVAGHPAKVHGLNVEGMKRRGWSSETIALLNEAYQVIFKNGLTIAEAIETLTNDLLPKEPKIQIMINSLKNTKRGIIR